MIFSFQHVPLFLLAPSGPTQIDCSCCWLANMQFFLQISSLFLFLPSSRKRACDKSSLSAERSPTAKAPSQIFLFAILFCFVVFQEVTLTTDAAEVRSQQPRCNCTLAHTDILQFGHFSKEGAPESLVTTKQQVQTGLQYCCPSWVYESIYTIYCTYICPNLNMQFTLHV